MQHTSWQITNITQTQQLDMSYYLLITMLAPSPIARLTHTPHSLQCHSVWDAVQCHDQDTCKTVFAYACSEMPQHNYVFSYFPIIISGQQYVHQQETIDMLIVMYCLWWFRLFIYPPAPATGGITVTNEDLYCLNDGEFLNDVIIDFYLKLVALFINICNRFCRFIPL